ncbi:hypothetical protein AB4567_30865, partial [Vibrio sp. 10N.222.51.A6]
QSTQSKLASINACQFGRHFSIIFNNSYGTTKKAAEKSYYSHRHSENFLAIVDQSSQAFPLIPPIPINPSCWIIKSI